MRTCISVGVSWRKTHTLGIWSKEGRIA